MGTEENEDRLNDAIGIVEDNEFTSHIEDFQGAVDCASSCEVLSDVKANLKEALAAAEQLVKDTKAAIKSVNAL